MSLLAQAGFTPIIERIISTLPTDQTVYLVGGAVRDLLMNRPLHDLDFVIPENALQTSRKLADNLGAAFFALDTERDAGRLIYKLPQGERLKIDFTSLRGEDLEGDLRKRDLTINAMAIDLRQPEILIDPLDGKNDLLRKRLRVCSPFSFDDDPLRILRTVRLAISLSFQLLPETSRLMRQSNTKLTTVSPERVRDELFQILEGHNPSVAIRTLFLLDCLTPILPELNNLSGVTQSAPHILDVWEHTLDTLHRLELLLDVLKPDYDPEQASNLIVGLTVLRLGRYRLRVDEHIKVQLNQDRSFRALLFFAALYHDIGKPQSRSIDANGRIRFFEHEKIGAQMGVDRALALHLSNLEIDRLKTIICYHLRPMLMMRRGSLPTRRSIYRYFKATGPAGVDICLLSLADLLATYGPGIPQDEWGHHLDVVRELLDAWWEKNDQVVSPPPLIKGSDLLQQFSLTPGPLIGFLLSAIREAQAIGQVSTPEEAIALAKQMLEDEKNKGGD
jgi:putative nucleotidyltransferase with HDIG domain